MRCPKCETPRPHRYGQFQYRNFERDRIIYVRCRNPDCRHRFKIREHFGGSVSR